MTIEQILYFGMLAAALVGFIAILCTIPYRRKKIIAQLIDSHAKQIIFFAQKNPL